jgi:hypothetical protein
MSDLLEKLKAGRAAIRRVPIGAVVLGLRVLTEQDYQAAHLAAVEALRVAGLELDMASAELFESEKASHLLALALVDPDTGAAITSSAKAVRESLSREEQAYVIEEYMAHEKQFAPSPRTLSDAEFAELLEEVKKSPQTPRLNASSSATLKKLIATLAAPLAS